MIAVTIKTADRFAYINYRSINKTTINLIQIQYAKY